MKNKKGFTLVELLAVIAILAVLVIIALPNVLKMFRTAKENTFASEVQNLVRSAEDKYLTSSMLNENNTCFDSKTNPLDMTGRENINYLIKLSNKGKVIEVNVIDDSYQLLIDNENGINKADIGNKYKIETRNKTTDILDCNNSFLVQGEEGTGEENAPYKIQYVEDLVELSKNVENGQTYEGKTFILSRNLDFKNKDSYKEGENSELYTQLTTGTGFTPIGVEDNYFKGNFDGKNHRIDNLYINNTKTEIDTLGLFGKIEDSTISNLTVSGSIEIGEKKSNGGMISNAIGTSKVINCTNEINIISENSSWTIGGIVATLEPGGNLTIENCVNKGKISGGQHIGGLVGGIASNGKITIENSKNQEIISTSSQHIGGLIGYLNTNSNTIITNSYNNAEIKFNSNEDKDSYIGGLIGYAIDESTIKITDSGNNANITNLHTDYNKNVALIIGGLIGEVNKSKSIKVNNSYNKGNITTSMYENVSLNINQFFGGIIGKFNSMPEDNNYVYTIKSTYNTGNITDGNRVGGIIGGNIQNVIVIIDNCYNSGNLSSNQIYIYNTFIGGLIGSDWVSSKTIILNSYNKGNLKSLPSQNNSSVGGIVGAANDGASTTSIEGYLKIINSYNVGEIVGKNNTSSYGISKSGDKDKLLLNNVYNVGNVTSNDNNTNYAIGNLINDTYTINNTYYKNDIIKNGTNLSKDSELTTGKSEIEMKNQSFVTLLNTNKSSIDLSSIDSRLSGYTLCDWNLGVSGYPELDCK